MKEDYQEEGFSFEPDSAFNEQDYEKQKGPGTI